MITARGFFIGGPTNALMSLTCFLEAPQFFLGQEGRVFAEIFRSLDKCVLVPMKFCGVWLVFSRAVMFSDSRNFFSESGPFLPGPIKIQ